VGANGPAAGGLWRLRLEAPGIGNGWVPGQFANLLLAEPGGTDPLLRRPLAPCEVASDALSFAYAARGRGTALLTAFRPGRGLDLLAPLGRGYTLPAPGSPALLVGGGSGLPSLGPLAARLAAAGHRVHTVAGAARAGALAGLEIFRAAGTVTVATVDGSEGTRGTAMDALRAVVADGGPAGARPVLFACGPRGLLAAVAGLAERRGLACQVSLEERMACGFGACMGCAVAVRGPDASGGLRYARVCREGPVFEAGAIAWDGVPDPRDDR